MGPEVIDDCHERLRDRFIRLRGGRDGAPVYALEHGLDAPRLQALRRAVGGMVRLHGAGPWWRSRHLPLLILATETGYHYRGTGTDFWPVLAASLGAEFHGPERRGMTALFEEAHTSLGLKRPADTPWNRAFRHIAWPISNAIAPLEIHRPLAHALQRMFLRPPPDFGAAELAGALRRAAARDAAPRRLMDWLDDDSLAASMAGRLLRLPEDSELSAEVVDRIWTDLSSDALARRAVGRAVAEHRRLQGGVRASESALGRGWFTLHALDGQAPGLRLTPPVLGPAQQERLRRRVRGHRVSLWSLTQPLDLEDLLDGRPIPLRLDRLPRDEDVFIPDRGLEGLEPGSLALLRGLAPDLRAPLVFPAQGAPADQTFAAITGPGKVWRLLTRETPRLVDGVSRLGCVADAGLYEVDGSTPSALAWMSDRGVRVAHGPGLDAPAGPLLRHGLRGPVFPAGMPVLLKLTGPVSDVRIQNSDGEARADLDNGRPFLLASGAEAGDHRLRLLSGLPDADFSWVQAGPDDVAPGPPLTVSVESPDLTWDALLAGELAIRISAIPGLAIPAVRVSVVIGGRELAAARDERPPSPALYGPGSALMTSLAFILASAPPPASAQLVVELAGISRDWWPLGRRLRTVLWVQDDQGWRPTSDGTAVRAATVAAADPTAAPIDDVLPEDTIQLLLAETTDGVADGEGLVVAPRRLSLTPAAGPQLPSRLLRRWDDRDGTGLGRLARAWVRWSCASSTHPVAEAARRRTLHVLEPAVVAQLCGHDWASAEAARARFAGDLWLALAEAALGAGMAAGDGCPQLPDEHRPALRRHLAARFREAAPDLWAAPESVDGHASALDEAVNEAWEDHFQGLEREGATFHLEDSDAGNSGEAWAGALNAARALHEQAALARRVLPVARARLLTGLDYACATPGELAALLEDEHVDMRPRGQPRWLSEADLRCAVLFWTDPRGLLREEDWQVALSRLLADRQTARAVRYAALRYADARGSGNGVR